LFDDLGTEQAMALLERLSADRPVPRRVLDFSD
jgi:hypothetical protein